MPWTDTDESVEVVRSAVPSIHQQKVNNTDEWTKIDSKYDGKCYKCDAPYGKGAELWVCNKQYFDSLDCLKARFPNATEKVKEGGKREDKASSTPLVMCENCGDSVNHVTHIISIGGRDIDMNICDRCEWLRRAAWQLKLNGMWKPTPRNEPLREVKA